MLNEPLITSNFQLKFIAINRQIGRNKYLKYFNLFNLYKYNV